mgnify:CR=1 FL=1
MLFVFLLFMSISSFALAYLTYMGVIKMFGVNNKLSTYAQLLIIPTVVIGYDMLTVTSKYAYWIGSLPIVLVAAVVIHFHMTNKKTTQSPQEAYKASGMSKQFKNTAKKNKRK